MSSAATLPPVDPKDQKALVELQEKLTEHTSALKNLQNVTRSNESAAQRARLTAAEVTPLADDTRMYFSVGKAYFYEPKPTILTKLAETIKAAEEEVKSAAQSKEYIAKNIHSTEEEIRELLHSAPGLAARFLPQEGQ